MSLRDVPPWLVLRQVLQPLHAGALAAAVAFAGDTPLPPLDLVCIYRRRNAPTVWRLLAGLPEATPRLWALDEPDDSLAAETLGSGPGTRPELLNRLVAEATPPADRWLVVADDDVRFPPGQLRLLVRVAVAAGLDVSQPAHLARSYASWRVNRQRLSTLVRLTRFVEQGPVMLLSPFGRASCLPLPESLGMGWGVEVHFATAASGRLRLGIVDAAGVRHLTPIAKSYDREGSEALGRQALAAAGYGAYGELQAVSARWPLWRRRPPWAVPAAGGQEGAR